MAQPYIGEIRMFAGNFAPVGWENCNGQLLPISENDALFTLIGTTYGGDGQQNFALPDLQSRVPMHFGTGPGLSSYQLGETGGTESQTLTTQQIPNHTHQMITTTSPGTNNSPSGAILATSPVVDIYIQDTPTKALAPSVVGPDGGSQPHENRMPFIVIRYIISLFGIFPSQT